MCFVDIGHSLSEVVGSSTPVVHSLQSQDCLVHVLAHFGSSEAQELGSHPQSHLSAWAGFGDLLHLLGSFHSL